MNIPQYNIDTVQRSSNSRKIWFLHNTESKTNQEDGDCDGVNTVPKLPSPDLHFLYRPAWLRYNYFSDLKTQNNLAVLQQKISDNSGADASCTFSQRKKRSVLRYAKAKLDFGKIKSTTCLKQITIGYNEIIELDFIIQI